MEYDDSIFGWFSNRTVLCIGHHILQVCCYSWRFFKFKNPQKANQKIAGEIRKKKELEYIQYRKGHSVFNEFNPKTPYGNINPTCKAGAKGPSHQRFESKLRPKGFYVSSCHADINQGSLANTN